MSTPQNNMQKARQFRLPSKPSNLEDKQEAAQEQLSAPDRQSTAAPLSQSPVTGRQGTPGPLFQVPVTGKQDTLAPSFQSPVTGRHITPIPAFRLPMNDQQGASAIPSQFPETGRQSTVPFPETGRQNIPPVPPIVNNRYDVASLAPTAPVTGRLEGASFPLPETGRQSTPPFQPPATDRKRISRLDKGTPFIAILFNIVLIALVMWQTQIRGFPAQNYAGSSSPQAKPTPSLNAITNNKEISPLVFGTNMALFQDSNEPLLNSAKTRQALKDIGVRIIRMPTRATLKDQTEIAAAQAIKEIGAVPLVVIGGPGFKDGSLLENDLHILGLINRVFTNETVYYEFGNESDLSGIDADAYAATWNQVIPRLKAQYPNARFIGPDNYQFTRRYIKTFLQKAQPRPDGVSWHEYTCSVHWTAAFCLANIDSWSVHFAQARAAMQEAIGTTLPLWISEWNYASDQEVINGQPTNDGKYNNPAFMQAWTTKAIESLVANRIFAAMQYFSTNQPMPLVINDHIGSEGQIFQQEYKKIMVNGSTPPLASMRHPQPVSTVDPKEMFSFEDGTTDGWTSLGAGISQPIVTTDKAFDGSHALQITLDNASQDAYPYLSIPGDQLKTPPKAGQMLSAYIYVANKAALVNAKIFVANPAHAWLFANDIALTPGVWNKVWYALPVDFPNQVSQVGIQFVTDTPGVSSTVYVDAINWK